jgi:uncharacterized repeat protein (TIGR03806 family)
VIRVIGAVAAGAAVFAGCGLALSATVPTRLNVPESETGDVPELLSQTGVFQDLPRLKGSPGMLLYDLNVAFWSDGAIKHRWLFLPPGQKIVFDRTNEWRFPNRTVFVKTFEMPVDSRNPENVRRLETRLLVRNGAGGVYGVTYKWRQDNSDADLLFTNLSEEIPVRTPTGVRTQVWYYPSRSDCQTCHTPLAGGVLGLNARQLNRQSAQPAANHGNQLRRWNDAGVFDHHLSERELSALPSLVDWRNTTLPIDLRVRSWLDVNCAYCHRPGGTVANFDARLKTPLVRQGLIDGPVLIDEGVDDAKVIAPRDSWRSILFMRANTTEAIKMPPLARNEIDVESIRMLRQWIESLPGKQVVPPPWLSPAGGNFTNQVEITISASEPGAIIHYTTDGSVPTKSDPIYHEPVKLNEPAVVRARAYKAGWTKSVTSQQVYTFDN